MALDYTLIINFGNSSVRLMKCDIYISDEGVGPIVRQKAITEAFLTLSPECKFNIKTSRHFDAAKRIVEHATIENSYNNISWHKLPDGSPDIPKIKLAYSNYEDISQQYLVKELSAQTPDFIISDFVVEAFEIAKKKNIPGFGIAHFTWEWFFSKLSPPPLSSKIINLFKRYTESADILFFPPFTPKEILKAYGHKTIEVPLIVRNQKPKDKRLDNKKFKVLLIDSGSGVLFNSIQKAISSLGNIPNVQFYASSVFESFSDNLTLIDKNELFVDYINQVDLVIGRAGFNTISECIAYRTPMLLLGEAFNPEMEENIRQIKREGLCSFLSIEQLTKDLNAHLQNFIEKEYDNIKRRMNMHDYQINGAEMVASEIINRLN